MSSAQAIQQQIIESHQYLHSLSPSTLLPIELAAHLLGKSPATIRTNVSVNPSSLPVFIRSGRRIFFQKGDIDSFLLTRRVLPVPLAQAVTTITPRRGRPTNASKLLKAGV